MYQVIDRDGRPRWLEDHEVVPDGATLVTPVTLMDARAAAAAPPAGQYTLIDRCGRPAGLGRVDLAEKAAAARADYRERLSNAHKRLAPLRDGTPALRGQALYRWRLENAHKYV